MSASVNDKIVDTRNAARPNSARATGTRSAGGTSLACDNLAGWPTASKVHFVTYQIDSSSAQMAGTQLDCTGIVSGNTIGSITVVDGTDVGNSVNDVVEMIPTAAWGQDLADALTNQHSRTGTHTVITATSLTTTGNSSIGGNATIAGNLAVTGTTTLTGTTTITALSNPYKFSVYRNAAQNIGSGAYVVLQCDTKIYDTGSNVDIVTNKGRFTAPIAGFYQFNALVQATVTGTGIMGISLFKNGIRAIDGGFISTSAFVNTVGNGVNVSAILQLAANDYVEAQIFGNSAYAITVGTVNESYGASYFQGFLVSAT